MDALSLVDSILIDLTEDDAEHENGSGLQHCRICNRNVLRRNYKRHVLSLAHLKRIGQVFCCSRNEGLRIVADELQGYPPPPIPLVRDESRWRSVRGADFDRVYPQLASPSSELPPLPIPTHFRDEIIDFGLQAGWECAVCMEPMDRDRFHLTVCFHKVCKVCIVRLDGTCPVCRQ